MHDIKVSDMMHMQQALYEKNKDRWLAREPQVAYNFLLYLMEEYGEVLSIWKKKGSDAIMEDSAVRRHFCEEMSDVLMYFTEILLCYGVTPEEISSAYIEKFEKNMGRDYWKEYQGLYEG